MIQRKPPNPRKVAINAKNKKARRVLRSQKGVWPERDPKYLRFVGLFLCIQCFAPIWSDVLTGTLELVQMRHYNFFPSGTEAAHTGPHGLSQKASDYRTVPLCAYHHRIAKDCQQGRKVDWFEENGIDLEAVISLLNRVYREAA